MDCETLHCVQGDVIADVILSSDAIGTKNLDDYAVDTTRHYGLKRNSYYTLQWIDALPGCSLY